MHLRSASGSCICLVLQDSNSSRSFKQEIESFDSDVVRTDRAIEINDSLNRRPFKRENKNDIFLKLKILTSDF